MKRSIGSPNIQPAPDMCERRPPRRVSGTVRVSTTRVPDPAPSCPTDAPREPRQASAPQLGQPVTHAAVSDLSRALFRRWNVPVSLRATLYGSAIACSTLLAHWFVPAGAVHLLEWLAPVLLLMVTRQPNQRVQWALYAGLLWLALAWVELVHPAAGARPELHQLLALTVLAVIFFQLGEGVQHVQHLSQRDPLTGLLNRRGFEDLSAVELERSARYERPVAFALLDVDRFKAINDNFGHATGDRVLQIVSEELQRLRGSDLAVRLGGDEFGLLMPETDTVGAEQLVARLRQRIHKRMSKHGWPVTVSAGVASSGTGVHGIAALMADADSRMYASKLTRHA